MNSIEATLHSSPPRRAPGARAVVPLALAGLLLAPLLGHALPRASASMLRTVVLLNTSGMALTPSTLHSALSHPEHAVLGAITVGRVPRAVAVAEQTQRVFVANAGDNSLSVLDARTGAVLRTVPVGAVPAAVAVDEPTHRVFVAEAGANSVRVLDAHTAVTLRTVPVGAAPTALAVDVPTARVFVANSGNNSVSLLDAHSGALLRTVRVGTGPQGGPRAVAVAARAGRAFVASGDSLLLLDAGSGAVLRSVPTGIGTLAGNPVAIAVDERLSRVFVANESLPDADSPWDNSLVLLNARTGDVLGNLPLDAPPVAVAVDARTERVYLAAVGPRRSGRASDPGSVSVLDARTGAVRRTITLGRSPRAIALDTRTERAFVVSGGSNTVAILDGTG
jgi:YVTN family beta-propeller protein